MKNLTSGSESTRSYISSADGGGGGVSPSPKIAKIVLENTTEELIDQPAEEPRMSQSRRHSNAILSKIKNLNSSDLEEVIESGFVYNSKMVSLTFDSLKLVEGLLRNISSSDSIPQHYSATTYSLTGANSEQQLTSEIFKKVKNGAAAAAGAAGATSKNKAKESKLSEGLKELQPLLDQMGTLEQDLQKIVTDIRANRVINQASNAAAAFESKNSIHTDSTADSKKIVKSESEASYQREISAITPSLPEPFEIIRSDNAAEGKENREEPSPKGGINSQSTHNFHFGGIMGNDHAEKYESSGNLFEQAFNDNGEKISPELVVRTTSESVDDPADLRTEEDTILPDRVSAVQNNNSPASNHKKSSGSSKKYGTPTTNGGGYKPKLTLNLSKITESTPDESGKNINKKHYLNNTPATIEKEDQSIAEEKMTASKGDGSGSGKDWQEQETVLRFNDGRDRFSLPEVLPGTIPLSSRGPGENMSSKRLSEDHSGLYSARNFGSGVSEESGYMFGSIESVVVEAGGGGGPQSHRDRLELGKSKALPPTQIAEIPSCSKPMSPKVGAHPGPRFDDSDDVDGGADVNESKGSSKITTAASLRKNRSEEKISTIGAFKSMTSRGRNSKLSSSSTKNVNLGAKSARDLKKEPSASKKEPSLENYVKQKSAEERNANTFIAQEHTEDLLTSTEMRFDTKSATPMFKNDLNSLTTPAKKPDLETIPEKELEIDHSPLQMSLVAEDMSILSERSKGDELPISSEKKFHDVIALAKKERNIIKLYMKSQYGNQETSYHKADYGNLYQKKFLIDAKWWRMWKEFVQFDSKDDDDESFNQAALYPRPCEILNNHLIENLADVEADPAGAEVMLKDNLLEHHDFEAVNKRVFDAFLNWYGCDFAINRLLRLDPARPGKYLLDLYPKGRSKSAKGKTDTAE